MKMEIDGLEGKMKRGFFIILVLALVAGLFISCSNEANEDLAYVEFSAGDGRSLVNGVSMTDDLGNAYPVSGVYWYYTAKKTDDSRGTVGSTLKTGSTGDALEDHNPVLVYADGGLSGSVGPFSPGLWSFKLYGYNQKEGEGKKLIYTGASETVTLSRGNAATIPVSIVNAITTGKVEIVDLNYYDGNDGALTAKSVLSKVGSAATPLSVQYAVNPTLVTETDKPFASAIVGTYYYKVPLFGTTAPSLDNFNHIKDISYANGKMTAEMDTGAYKLKTELWYGTTLVNTILDTSFIVYPGEVKTISGGVYESDLLPSVQFTETAVARLDHPVTSGQETTTYRLWFDSLQEAVNSAVAGDTVYLLKDLSSVSIEVSNAIEIKGIKASAITSAESITTYSGRTDLFVYSSIADTEDNTKVNLKFYLNPTAGALQTMVDDETTTAYWLSGTLPGLFVAGDNGVISKINMRAVPLTLENKGNEVLTVTVGLNGTLYYSIGEDGERTERSVDFENPCVIEVPVGKSVSLYANKRDSGIGIQCDKECYIYGNVMSLIDASNYVSLYYLSYNDTFAYTFAGNTKITNHPVMPLVLPATDVRVGSYRYMFQGCTGLTSAPELPAMTLKSNCYEGMFSGCTGLTSAPNLPATTMLSSLGYANECYKNMFEGCTALTSAPTISATTLAPNCCKSMFSGCTALTTVPVLPATTLAAYCYNEMFCGCTGLTAVPANLLPAESLVEHCYLGMFKNCTHLTGLPSLPAMTMADNCYEDMFLGCTGLTTVPNDLLPATTLAPSCYDAIFKDCTSLTTAPALPATTLAVHCYDQMFWGCTSLVKSPVLPAEELVDQCYYGMFAGCTSLNEITCYATNTLFVTADGAPTSFWVGSLEGQDFPSSGTFNRKPGVSWMMYTNNIGSDSSIPSGWTISPEYPTKTITIASYDDGEWLRSGGQATNSVVMELIGETWRDAIYRQTPCNFTVHIENYGDYGGSIVNDGSEAGYNVHLWGNYYRQYYYTCYFSTSKDELVKFNWDSAIIDDATYYLWAPSF